MEVKAHPLRGAAEDDKRSSENSRLRCDPTSDELQLRQRCAAFYSIIVEPPLEILHHLRLDHRRRMRTFQHICHFKPWTISKGCHLMSHPNVERGRLHRMSSHLRGRHDDSALADCPMMRPGRLLSGGDTVRLTELRRAAVRSRRSALVPTDGATFCSRVKLHRRK